MQSADQGMYKNRVKNDRKILESPTLLSCERGNPERKNSKLDSNYMNILNFPAPFSAGFPCSQDKRVGISKKEVCHFLPYFYIYTLAPPSPKNFKHPNKAYYQIMQKKIAAFQSNFVYCMQIAAGTINTLTTGVEIIQTSLLLAQD